MNVRHRIDAFDLILKILIEHEGTLSSMLERLESLLQEFEYKMEVEQYDRALGKPEIPIEVKKKWQKIVDLMAKIIDVPAGLIMKLEPPYIQVFISSATEGNPYREEDTEHLAGLYCETVIKSKEILLIPNALKDDKWKDSPDVKVGMISYLGLPLDWPDGEPFGTICVLDEKENEYNELYINLMHEFKDVVETDLRSLLQINSLKKTAYILETLMETRTRQLVELEQRAEAGRIATMVAHDLQSLLQKIKDNINLLRREPEKKEEILKAVEDSVDFATRRLKEIQYRTQESTQNS